MSGAGEMVAKIEDPASAAKRARLRAVAPSDAPAKRVGNADTLPPMPLKTLLSAGGAGLYVVSVDSELIDTVRRAGGEHYPVFDVPRFFDLDIAIAAHQCGIALLDADMFGSGLAERIAELDQYSSRLVILVAAERTAAQGLMGLLSERKIHRLLMKPAALGITRLLVESAVNRCIALREAAADQPADAALPVARARAVKRVPVRVLVAAAAALLFGVGAIAAYSSWRSEAPRADTTIEAASPAEAQPVATEPEQRFTSLLAAAATAFREGRLTQPPGDNALDHYLAILAADPAEPTARQQLAVVGDALFAQAETALLADDHDGAADALAHARRADPASARLAFLEAQLERARVAATAAAATVAAPVETRAAADPARTELASLITIAKARLERGALLTPRGDSAAEYVDRAARLAADDEDVVALRAALAAELVATASRALADMDFDGAAAAAEQARRFGASSSALAELGAQVATARADRAARQHSEWLALAERRRATGALIAPADDSAQHYLERVQNEAPNLAGLSAAWQAWRTALAAEARGLIGARNWAEAETRLAALEKAPQGGALAAPLRADLEHGRLQEQYLATAVPTSELTLLKGAAPRYPVEAEQRGIEGWVDLEFIVDTTGRPKDLKVTASEPPRRFDEVASEAVAQYRFAPFERDGRAFERRVRVRVRFTLK